MRPDNWRDPVVAARRAISRRLILCGDAWACADRGLRKVRIKRVDRVVASQLDTRRERCQRVGNRQEVKTVGIDAAVETTVLKPLSAKTRCIR